MYVYTYMDNQNVNSNIVMEISSNNQGSGDVPKQGNIIEKVLQIKSITSNNLSEWEKNKNNMDKTFEILFLKTV